MTLSLFWSRYTLELRAQHMREVDEQYHYLIARERWNWFLTKIPESEQVRLLHGHNHGTEEWTCRVWLEHMVAWVKEHRSSAVYAAIIEKMAREKEKSMEALEKQVAYTLSEEELCYFQKAGYFQGVSSKEKITLR